MVPLIFNTNNFEKAKSKKEVNNVQINKGMYHSQSFTIVNTQKHNTALISGLLAACMK